MIDLSVRRPVATAALYAALLALGAYSFRLIPLELLPEVEIPRLTVDAYWPGASPEALEAFVTAPLEAAVQRVKGVRKVTSTSATDPAGTGSRATLEVEFARETRMDFARLELGERLSALRNELPQGVAPTIQHYVPPEFAEEDRPLLRYRLSGPYTFRHLGALAERELRPALLAVDGVSAVRVQGGEEREISVELDRGRLRSLRVRPDEVRRRLREISEPRAPGSVRLDGRQVALAVRIRATDPREIERVIVREAAAGPVRLADLGRVHDTTAEPRAYFRVDGLPAVFLVVYRQAGTNAVRLAAAVRERASGLGAALPPGARLELEKDASRDIRAQLGDLRLRALAAAVVIFLVLAFFLRSLGAVVVVFATIAFSVLLAVNLLYLGGFSLNVLTLAGLAWGFGLVVDNGIVVLENIERRRRVGEGGAEAARDGARQVALPVVAATLTTAIVLVPFLFLQGELRIYYLPLAYAVGFSILASLLVAFTFVPSLAARVRLGRAAAGPRPAPESSGVEARWAPAAGGSEPAGGGWEPGGGGGPRGGWDPASVRSSPGAREPAYVRAYRRLLGLALDHPLPVVLVCVASLAGSFWLFDRHVARDVPWTSFWGQDTYIAIQIRFPRGAGLERTDELARAFEAKLATLPDVKRYEASVRPRFASLRVTFPDSLERTAVPVAIKERLVAYSYGFSGVDVRVYGYGPSFYGGGASPPNYRLQVLGYGYLAVKEIAEELAGRLERFSRIRDVDPNASRAWYERDREFEYFVAPDRAALGRHGLTVEELLSFVSASVRGAERGRLRLAGEEVPFAVTVAGFEELDVRGLRELRIPAGAGGAPAWAGAPAARAASAGHPTGRAGRGGASGARTAAAPEVRLGDVARVGVRDVLSSIRREDQRYERAVAWEFRGPAKLGDLVRDAVVEAIELPPGYRIEADDRWRWSGEERAQVWLVLGFAVLLVYMVTAALFESLAAPLVVLLTLPLALIGVFLAFVVADATFTRTAYIGTIMMGGIVVNNAILVVHRIGELRTTLPRREAILRGTLERVRPILMTTLTTVFGLLPLVLFSAQDDNIWNALALATIGGLISSTLFVLVAVPVGYRWLVPRGGGSGRASSAGYGPASPIG